MLELILAIVGGYLIGDSIKESNPEEYAEGGELDDDIAYAKSKAMDNIDWDELLREYASNHYYELTQREKGEIISEMQKDWHRSYQFSEGGEVSKSWGVMLFKESKNRFGERIESAFNNLIMKGTLKQVIEDVKEELVGNVIYGTIKDRAGDVLVAKVKQDGTINIYREGYGFDKMAKGGEVGSNVSEAVEYLISNGIADIKKVKSGWLVSNLNEDEDYKNVLFSDEDILYLAINDKEWLPNGVKQNIKYKGTRFEKNLGYSLTDEKWKEIDKKGRLKQDDLGGVNDWRHAINEKFGYEKYKVEMYSPTLDRLRNQNADEFYTNRGYADGGMMSNGGNVKGYGELLGKFDYYEIKHKDSENNISYSYEKKSIGSPIPFNGTEISKEQYEQATNKMAKGGKVSDVYIFDIYLYSYNDEGSIDGVKEKRKMSVKASSRAKAYDIVKRKYPNPYFVELNRLKSDGNTKNN